MSFIEGEFLSSDSWYVGRFQNKSIDNQLCSTVKKYLDIKEQISKIIIEKKTEEFFSIPEKKDIGFFHELSGEAGEIKQKIDFLISKGNIIKNTEYYFDGYNCWRTKQYTVDQNVFTKYDRFFRSYLPLFDNGHSQIYRLIHHKKFKILKLFYSEKMEIDAIERINFLYNILAKQGSMELFMKYKGIDSNVYISKSYDCNLFECLSSLTNKEKLCYIQRVLLITLYIQKINFIHGDIKLENLFIDKKSNSLVLGDLDSGVFLGKNYNEIVKTALDIYLKKIKIHKTHNYFSKSIDTKMSASSIEENDLLKCCHNFDIYSSCIVIIEILLGRCLGRGEPLPDLISQIDSLELTKEKKYDLLLLINAMKDPLNCDLQKHIAILDPSIVEEAMQKIRS